MRPRRELAGVRRALHWRAHHEQSWPMLDPCPSLPLRQQQLVPVEPQCWRRRQVLAIICTNADVVAYHNMNISI